MALLLSWFGTLLYVETAAGAAVRHAPPWPIPAGTMDLSLDVPLALTEITPTPGLPGVFLVPASRPGLVHINTDSHELILDPAGAGTAFHARAGVRVQFLLVREKDIENLRYILAHGWALDGSPTAPERPARINLLEHFLLDIEGDTVDLVSHWPVMLPPDAAAPAHISFSVQSDRGILILHRLPGAASRDIWLRQRDKLRVLPEVRTVADLHLQTNSWVKLEAPDEIVSLPMTVCESDRAWMHRRPRGEDPLVGRHRFQPMMCRESSKFVLLSRWAEGVIFDRNGVSTESAFVRHLITNTSLRSTLPTGLQCDGDRITLAAEAADQAPILRGPHVVFYSGLLTNYAHWLIDFLLQLYVMQNSLPPGARILLPGTLRHMRNLERPVCDHHDMLRVCGFGETPQVEVDAPLCWVEDVYWLSGGDIGLMPAAKVRAFQQHILARRPAAPSARLRLYLARRHSRRVRNAEPVLRFLAQHGFTMHYVEDLSFDAQIELFRQAEFVISPHGAELGNLLFCEPGTKVLELAPDIEFKPYFAYLSSKLGFVHTVLPCPTHDQGFFGGMTVDMGKLSALFRMLRVRL